MFTESEYLTILSGLAMLQDKNSEGLTYFGNAIFDNGKSQLSIHAFEQAQAFERKRREEIIRIYNKLSDLQKVKVNNLDTPS